MGPHWIKQWINNLAVLNEQFRDDEGRVDFEALGREEYLFRMALITKDFTKSERARDTFMSTKASYDKWVENGKQGGRPRNNQETTADAPTREDGDGRDHRGNTGTQESITSANNFSLDSRTDKDGQPKRRTGASLSDGGLHSAPVRSFSFPNKRAFIQWAIDNGLDPEDAGECWEATVERGGKDRDGKTVKNMKAYAVQWCQTRKNNRRSA